MSAQFSKGDKVRCIKTWTTYVIDSGSEYEVDGVHIDAIDGEMLYVESQWVPAHYFEKVGPQRDFDCCIAASHIHGTINTPIGSVSGTLSAEPEDKADLYVEPEPLKEGDAVLVWAKVVDPEQDELGDFAIDVMYGATFDRTFARADAIVRPDAGQVPPWLVEVEVEQPTGLGAIVEAIRPGDVIPSRFIRHYALVTHPGKRWVSSGGTRYSWADLKDPQVLSEGWTDGGAS